MNQPTPLQTRHAAAAARVKAATESLGHQQQAIARTETEIVRLSERMAADPKDVESNFAHGRARGDLNRAQHGERQAQSELATAQRELAEVERLLTGDAALEKAREVWRAASAAQIEATRTAQAMREKLAKLDALLQQEEGKTAAAQEAQRAAILASHGFADEPAAEVSVVQDVLLGAAAQVDALRAGRPAIEAKVKEAEAALAERDKDTQRAVQAILNAKAAITEAAALQALEQCRAAVQAYHAATAASGRGFGERLALYESDQSFAAAAAFDRQVERLKASAFAGE